MQCALAMPIGLSHLLQAFQCELDENPDFKAAVDGDIIENKKKRKAHVLESTTFTSAHVSKPSRAAARRYEDSMEEDEERDDGHEGGDNDSDVYSEEELVYEPPRNKRPRLDDLENRSASSTTSNGSADDVDDLIIPSELTTLPPSKNPCLDALAFCVVMGYGAEQTEDDMRQSTISIYDCQKLLSYIKMFCPKQTQTNNDEYRVKALKRWFSDMPTKKMRTTGNSFVIRMKADRRRIIQRVIRRMQAYVKAIKLE